jgi:hypothetical protein
MFTSRILRKSVLTIAALAGLACGDYSSPTSPSSYKPKVLSPSMVNQPSFSRYILISGVWVCVDCASEASTSQAGNSEEINK